MISTSLQALSELLPQTYEPGVGREPIPGFFCEFRGKVWRVKSILERTAVLQDTEDFYQRRLGKLSEVMVDPAVVEWRADTGARFTDGGQPDYAARARLRGRAASNVTTAKKRAEARERGNLASQAPRIHRANQGQRRWNGQGLIGEPTEADLLRAQGKARCPGCGEVFERPALKRTICSPCQNLRVRDGRARRKVVV